MSLIAQLVLAFATLSLIALGGGVAMLPELERLVTINHHWVQPADFAQLYSLGQLAPGPNGIVVLLIGYRVAGAAGALAATLAFFGPSSLVAWSLGRAWRRLAGSPWSASLHHGLAPFTIGLMLAGVYGLGKSSILGPGTATIAVGVAALVLAQRINPALLILGGGLAGWLALG